MSAYLISIVNVKDAAQYGGRFLLRGAPLEVLEGRALGERVVVSEWQSADQARKYYNSPEYTAAKSHRAGVAEATIMLFEGLK